MKTASRFRRACRWFHYSALIILPLSAWAATNDLTSALQKGLFEEEANHNLEAAAQAYQAVSARFDQDRKLAATAIFRLGEVYRKQGKTNEATAQYERIVREFSDQQTLVTLSRQNLAGLGTGSKAVVPPATDAEASARLATARMVQLLTAELARLKGLSSAETRIAVQQNYPNPVLTELMKQSSVVEQRLTALRQDFSTDHPEVKATSAQADTINKQIGEQVEGAIRALEFKLESAKAALAQSGSVLPPLTPAARLEQKRLVEEEIKLVEQDLADLKKQLANGVVSQSEVRAKEREVLKLRQQVAALDVDAREESAGASVPLVTDEEEKEIRRIQALIQNSPDLINAGQNPPIFPAVEAGYLKVVRFLLDHGAGVNGRSQGATPLHLAAKRGQKAMAELLLSRGAEVNARNTFAGNSTWNRTPLHEAAEAGFQAVVEVLLANKADLSAREADGDAPLHLAARRNRANVVALLAPRMPEINVENDKGITALGFAAAYGNTELVKAMLVAKADVNAGKRDVPLLAAINSRQGADVIELLLRQGANPNHLGVATQRGTELGGSSYSTITPLRAAVNRSEPEIVKRLIQFKADVNSVDEQHRSVLSYATDNTNIVKLLLEAKAEPDAGSADSPLLMAVRADNPVLAELLLRAGANPNQETETWILNPVSTPPGLPGPSIRPLGSADLGTTQRRSGSTRRSFNNSGQRAKRTPLQIAVLEDYSAMVKLLIQFKGDPKAKSPDGYPLVANTLRDVEMLRAFLDAGADANASDWDRRPILLSAAQSGSVEAVKLLLAHRAEVNARDEEKHTSLHLAVAWGRKEATEALLANGADPNLRDKNDQTPLDYTKQRRVGEDFAALLRKHGALDDLPKLDRIEVRRPSAKYAASVFWRGTNDWNQFTLLELIAVEYGLLSTHYGGKGAPMQVRSEGQFLNPWQIENERKVRNSLPFPDFSRVVIRRPAADGQTREVITVDVAAMIQSGDCSKDVPLNWGDVVEIAEADHPIDERWSGFSDEALSTLKQCLTRTITISVKDQSVSLSLSPWIELEAGKPKSLVNNRPFALLPVLQESKLLRASSDLSRVKIARRNPTTGKTDAWVVDCSDPNNAPNLWLRDGDLIEVPDKSQSIFDTDSAKARAGGKVLLSGNVKNPVVTLDPGRPMSLLEAVLQAGNKDFANLKRVELHRTDPTTKTTEKLVLNVEAMTRGDRSSDVLLQDGDLIHVPSRTFNY